MLTVRNASTSPVSSVRGAFCAKARGPMPVSAKPTVSAPPFRRARRENVKGAFMSASLPGGGEDRAHDPDMRAAAAEIALKLVADIGLAWFRIARDEAGSGHDHAACAIPALRHLFLDESRLQRMRRGRVAEPFKRGDGFALHVCDSGLAGARRFPVDQDGAGAALSKAAAEFRGRQADVTQDIEERLVRI